MPVLLDDVHHGRDALRRVVRAGARRPGLVLSIGWAALVAVAAVAPGMLTSRPPLRPDTAVRLHGPSLAHPFGTDQLGRDLFSRVVHGSGRSLQAASVAVAIGLLAGVAIGLLAGFARGPVDTALMRAMDALLAIPSFLLALAVLTVLGFGSVNLGLAVGVANVAGCARIMRSEVLRVRDRAFVEAARLGGARPSRVLVRHVLPNSLGPVLVLATLQFGIAILTVSSLSFLGYGTQPPNPEWGALVADGRDLMQDAWWLTTMPGLTVTATVLAAHHISRALDDRYVG
jgi:peptide/nickel transport system permease protein